ncbi:MerR family transcriptional regulator [Amycolatopsis sp. 195334CR]|uniref:MerR family transcriptional regulator n=1 Tax=Amycolatopsis sp. 195334CR TaxID=2814588 RepID=UPI001A8FBCFA|nr:MerR family transcriptional regulator [Amycolatopsis sp. 195334CR]MBN6039548.1 MerR family transcriptional regulator [Amycolatopsis sp. 195334CR]
MSTLNTATVARRAGCSVQQVRNLERDGVLPPAARTDSGYRLYREVHVRCALAYRALAAGSGPVEAKKIMRAAHRDPGDALARLDAAHARLHTERLDLRLAEEAAEAISAEPLLDVRAADAMSVSELAAALGVRPSTLRHWDAEGLVVPDRDETRGARRVYSPAQVRDARIVHQLRGAGYRVGPLRTLMPQIRLGRRGEDLRAVLAARQTAITARSRALLDGAAALSAAMADSGDV